MKGRVGPVKMTVDREADRVFVEYEKEKPDGTLVQIKETWAITK